MTVWRAKRAGNRPWHRAAGQLAPRSGTGIFHIEILSRRVTHLREHAHMRTLCQVQIRREVMTAQQ